MQRADSIAWSERTGGGMVPYMHSSGHAVCDKTIPCGVVWLVGCHCCYLARAPDFVAAAGAESCWGRAKPGGPGTLPPRCGTPPLFHSCRTADASPAKHVLVKSGTGRMLCRPVSQLLNSRGITCKSLHASREPQGDAVQPLRRRDWSRPKWLEQMLCH